MKRYLTFLCLMAALSASLSGKPEDTIREFLLYQYGGAESDIAALCVNSDDLWMLRGAPQSDKQEAVRKLKLKAGANTLFMDMVERDICIVELKEGKVDTRLNLETVYQMHRRLILQFLYLSLVQEKGDLSRLVTKIENLSFGGAPKASYGDMDVYAEILQIIPIVRSSLPETDAESKSITYRLPLGDEMFFVRLVKQGSTWKIDTDKKITVPLRYFWK